MADGASSGCRDCSVLLQRIDATQNLACLSRLSVEQGKEVASSPAHAISTKRVSRLPKPQPQLDNIVGNAAVYSSNPATGAPESTQDDKVSTPAKRVVRIRSNMRLSEAPVSESPKAKSTLRRNSFAALVNPPKHATSRSGVPGPAEDDKVSTPGKRVARVRSNMCLSEARAAETPRPKRSIRRNSCLALVEPPKRTTIHSGDSNPTEDDKESTPGKRSTLLRSNMALSETQVAETPKPKRTLRRNSFLAVVDPVKPMSHRSRALEPTEDDKVSTPAMRVVRVRSNMSLTEAPVAASSRDIRDMWRSSSLAGIDQGYSSNHLKADRSLRMTFNKVESLLQEHSYTLGRLSSAVEVLEQERMPIVPPTPQQAYASHFWYFFGLCLLVLVLPYAPNWLCKASRQE